MRELLYIAAAAKIRRQEAAREVWEPFDPDKQYEIGNKVVYEGSSYLVYQIPPIGTLPTDTDYFTIICQGVDLDVYEAIFTARDDSETARDESRKWVDGTGATEGDPQFDNHSKYHAEESKAWATGTGATEGDEQYENNAKYYAEEAGASEAAAALAKGAAEDAQGLSEAARDTAKAWATGTGATEGDPQFDNHSKYHAEESKAWAIGTADTEKDQHNNSAKDHATAAKTSEDNAKISELNADDYQRLAARVLADVLAILGTPGGLATLDANGKLTATQIPNITLNDMIDVASVAEMLALTTDDVQNGDVCRIVEDGTITAVYYLADDQYIDNINSWRELKAGYAAQSGHASTADTASDADRVNGHRHIDMTDEQYDAAQQAGTIVLTDFYYTYSE